MIKNIIVVGGGIGGTMTANNLVSKLYAEISRGEVRIILISNSPWHYYKPAFMYVAFGAFYKDELRRHQASLLRPEIDFVLDQVDGFERANHDFEFGNSAIRAPGNYAHAINGDSVYHC